MPLILQELDLNNPATFRDLSRPMGAQTPERLKQFKKRYQDWDDPQGNKSLLRWMVGGVHSLGGAGFSRVMETWKVRKSY